MDFSIDFRVLAAGSEWNNASLRGAFYRGLCDLVKDELAARDEVDSLDALIALATRVDNRLRHERVHIPVSSHPLRSPPTTSDSRQTSDIPPHLPFPFFDSR